MLIDIAGNENGDGMPAPYAKTLPRYETGLLDWFIPFGIFTLEHLQYIKGYPDGAVRPDDNITRAEAATAIFRLLAETEGAESLSMRFADTMPSAWYSKPVAYLDQIGIIQGYEDGTFKPDAPISRAECAALVSRFDAIEYVSPKLFSDVGANHWALSYISGAVAKGYFTGYPDGTFRPNDQMTRAEFVTTLNNILYRGIEAGDIPAWAPSYTDLSAGHWAYAGIIEASIGHDYERKDNGYEIWLRPFAE